MSKHSEKSRRSFLKKAVSTALITGTTPLFAGSKKVNTLAVEPVLKKSYAANDQVNIAVIGMGIMGFSNLATSVQIPGVKLVGVCDLYTGRLDRAKELYGKEIFTTKNYQEILDRKDVDAVFVATSDHWHDRISIDAMNKGKHVYCEKPMVHKLEEGAAVIEAQKKTGKVFQVGSQRVSSVVTDKARELFESKTIGDLILVETWNDRQGPNGAWQYSIPTDAKSGTVDWEKFIGDAPKMPYDPVRFFRWRNYKDYGTGIAGDLFVHLFSGLHAVTSSKGPNRILATGGLRYWKDGRDAPDIICGIYDYPETKEHSAFNLQMRVNFVSGDGGGSRLRLVGTDGVLTMTGGSVKIERNKTKKEPGYGGWDSFETFSSAQQKEYEAWYKAKYPQQAEEAYERESEFKAPEGYDDSIAHHANFYKGIREKAPVKEDAWFSMRAAGPALATNKSVEEKKIVMWNPEKAVVA